MDGSKTQIEISCVHIDMHTQKFNLFYLKKKNFFLMLIVFLSYLFFYFLLKQLLNSFRIFFLRALPLNLTDLHTCHLSLHLPAVRGPAASGSAAVEGHADSGDSRHAAGASLHCRGVAARSRYVTPLLHTRGDSCTIPVCPRDTQQPVSCAQSWLWVPATPSTLSFLWLPVDVGEEGGGDNWLQEKKFL